MNMHVASPSEPAVREPRVEQLTRAAFHGTYTTGFPRIFKIPVFGANTGFKSCHAEGEDVGSRRPHRDGDPRRSATMSDVGRRPYRWW